MIVWSLFRPLGQGLSVAAGKNWMSASERELSQLVALRQTGWWGERLREPEKVCRHAFLPELGASCTCLHIAPPKQFAIMGRIIYAARLV